jgi:hypothetical protein
MSKKFIKEGKMSVEFMREKKKMLILVGHNRDKKQLKSKGKSKKSCSSEDRKKVRAKKRPHEGGATNSSDPDKKRMKIESDEVAEASTVAELPSQEDQSAVGEQTIETQILEDVEDVLGVKEYVL